RSPRRTACTWPRGWRGGSPAARTRTSCLRGAPGGGMSPRSWPPPGSARGPKKHAKTDKTDSRHMRQLLADGRLPECWIPPSHILECRALLELYHDLRTGHTAWVQRIHAVLFHQGAQQLGEGPLRTADATVGSSRPSTTLGAMAKHANSGRRTGRSML